MAQVPDDEISSVQEEAIPGRAIPRISDDVNPAAFGATLGEGLDRAGQSLGDAQMRENEMTMRANEAGDEAQTKADQKAFRVKAAAAMTDISQIQDNILFGKDRDDPNAPPDGDAVYRQSGKQLATLPEDTAARFDAQVSQRLSQEPQEVQDMLDSHVQEQKSKMLLEAHRYQFEQSNREAVETYSNAQAQAIKTAYNNYRSPTAADDARNTILMAGHSLAELGGKDAIKAYNETGYLKDMNKLHSSDVDAYLADHNTAGAQKYLNKWSSDLSDGSVKEALQNKIDAEKNRLDAQEKDTSRDRIGDQMACYKAGLSGCDKLASPGDYQIVHKHDAQKYIDLSHKFEAAGTAEKNFDNQTPQQVQEALTASAPKVGEPGVEGDLEAQHLMQVAANSSLRRRQSDPADFAITTGKGWSPIDWSNQQAAAQELSKRSNTQQQISGQIGVQVPLLSKPEAQQLTNYLTNQSAQNKVAALSQLHGVVTDPRAYQSVLTQILPHSPVTAIVGAKMDRPNDWDMPQWYDPAHAANPMEATTILKGEELLNPTRGKGKETEEKGAVKGGFPMPSDEAHAGLQNYFARHSADLFNDRPQLADAHLSAFRDAYASLASDAGNYSGLIDTKIADKAFAMAVGKPVDYNDGRVVPPAGMDPSKFKSVADTAIAATLKDRGASAAYIKGIGTSYKLQELGMVGSGRYTLINGNMQPAQDPKNPTKPLIIDLNEQHWNAP